MTTYKKKISLSNKIYYWNDIIRLFTIINKEKRNPRDIIQIHIVYYDKSSISSDTTALLEESQTLCKRIIYLSMDYWSHDRDYYINLSLSAQDYHYDSEITIEATDNYLIRYEALITRFEDTLKTIKQQCFLSKIDDTLLISLVFPIVISSIIGFIISLFIKCSSSVTMGISSCVFTFLLFFKGWIVKTYPEIEFNFGPNWQNIVHKRQQQLKWWIGAIILPLVLSAAWKGLELLFLLLQVKSSTV